MDITLDITPYDRFYGIQFERSDGCSIEVQMRHGTPFVIANREGLVTLARILLTLAQDYVPAGAHVHWDDFTLGLPSSQELVLERMSEKKDNSDPHSV